MIFVLYLLGALMFLDCILLVFLVLLQLPKKEAGMGGMAFGGAATDALFGAGSGNVLTKITKYVAGLFFILAILMAWLDAFKPESGAASLMKKVSQSSGVSMAPAAPPAASPTATGATTPEGGLLQLSNLAPAGGTNAGSAKPPAAPVNTNK